MDKKVHKRFAGFLISSVLLLVGVLQAPIESFAVFAQTLGILYGAYLAGQSATDYKAASNGSTKNMVGTT